MQYLYKVASLALRLSLKHGSGSGKIALMRILDIMKQISNFKY